eukprot:TRINITY_DN2381_c0_g1_i2.p1 TRINITY_DN2381_c0_g1~~TRINITY_DN2381_c0_g1_i2.p1  ORF type:complete len:353 (+),score=51.42 TRINITY_DN2381_c0_g1_i2:226-1284(+)
MYDRGPDQDSPDYFSRFGSGMGSTWTVGDSTSNRGFLVVDMLQPRLIGRFSVFQMYSDGKVTHVQFFSHPNMSDNAPRASDTTWQAVHKEIQVNNDGQLGDPQAEPATKLEVQPFTTRYLRVAARNDGQYGNNSYIELRGVKAFRPNSILKPSDVAKLGLEFENIRQAGIKGGDSPDQPNIQPEGVTKLCTDFEINPDGMDYMVLAWQFGTKTPYEISKEELIAGCDRLNCTTVKQVGGKLREVINKLKKDPTEFRKFYLWCFDYMKPQPTAKSIPMDSAQATWAVVLEGRFKLLEKWIQFNTDKGLKSVPADVWRMVLKFASEVDDISTYSDSDGWPVVIDDFVDWIRERQ